MERERHAQLDTFLAQVERRAYRIAVLATRNRDDALDLVQDAMCALVQSYAARPAHEWPPLFHRILHARIVDWSRRRKVRALWHTVLGGRDDDGEDALANVPDPARATPDAEVAQGQAAVALERALQQLPLRQRQAFLLRVWEGLDVEQTAHAMQCSAGSVKTHLSRAMQVLRPILEEHV